MAYQVKLENFEGPLDLLLFLIQENEVDIYDIPVALVTKQYLEYLELMQLLDLEVGGEFVLMAATLIRIKSKMLLPRHRSDEETEEGDPRQELVQRLLEYRQFKEAAYVLGDQADKYDGVFFRISSSEVDEIDLAPEALSEMIGPGLNLWDLLRAFRGVLDRGSDVFERTIEREAISIEDRTSEILFRLHHQNGFFFHELFAGENSRLFMVVTFLALLELIRQRKVDITQTELLGDVWLSNPATRTLNA